MLTFQGERTFRAFSGHLVYGKIFYFCGEHMRILLVVACLFACGTSLQAQSGVSNVRDGNGNIVRDTGMNPVRGRNSVNNPNGPPTANVPAPTATSSRLNTKTER